MWPFSRSVWFKHSSICVHIDRTLSRNRNEILKFLICLRATAKIWYKFTPGKFAPMVKHSWRNRIHLNIIPLGYCMERNRRKKICAMLRVRKPLSLHFRCESDTPRWPESRLGPAWRRSTGRMLRPGWQTVPFSQKQSYRKYQRSQRAGGRHASVILFLTTMLFGCIVLAVLASVVGEGSCKNKNIDVKLYVDPTFSV